jgi:uncharacterized membrane protein
MPTLTSISSWYLAVAALLHAVFMYGEMFPWSLPRVLKLTVRKWPEQEKFSKTQQEMVSTTMHNASIYNAVLAGALLWAALHGPAGAETGRMLLVGVAVAGAFGTATLKLPARAGSAIQAVVGIVGLFVV